MREDKWGEVLSKIDTFKVTTILRNLIKIPSYLVYEAAKADYVVHEMERLGLEVIESIVEPPGRRSVVGILRGDGTGKSLIISSHLDTHWLNPEMAEIGHQALIKDGKIYGVGAGDSMPPLAATFGAVDAIKRAGIQVGGDVIILCAVDEMSYKEGIKTLQENGLKADMAIIGGATDFEIGIVHTGKVEVEVKTRGYSPFEIAAMSERAGMKAVNAIISMNKIVNYLLRMVREEPYFHKKHPLLPGEGAAFNIATIIGGSHGYGDPARKPGIKSELHGGAKQTATWCNARLSARYWPGQTSKEFVDLLKKWVAKARAEDPSVEVEINLYMDESLHIPMEIPPDAEIVKVLKRATRHVLGKEPKLTGHVWSTEAPYYQKAGIVGVCFGPGGMTHGGPEEHVKIEDLVSCCKIYTAAILDVCA